MHLQLTSNNEKSNLTSVPTRNSQPKRQFKTFLYNYNDEGDLQQAAAVNSQIKDLWTSTIYPNTKWKKSNS